MTRRGETSPEFLSRVRAALSHPSAPAAPPEVEDELLRLASPREDLLARFELEATAVGMELVRVDDPASATAAFLVEANVARVALGIEDGDLRASVERALDSGGVTLIENAFQADAGVTDVHAALAETGTLVLHPGSRQSRLVSLAPLLHVVILPASRVLPDMLDYLPRCAPDERGARILVTGPSKTADIEGELVCGVHGPARVRILLTD